MIEPMPAEYPADGSHSLAHDPFYDVPQPNRSPPLALRDLGLHVSIACDGGCFLKVEDCP